MQCRVVTTGEADTDTSLMSHRTPGSRGTQPGHRPGQPGDRGNSLLIRMQYELVSRRLELIRDITDVTDHLPSLIFMNYLWPRKVSMIPQLLSNWINSSEWMFTSILQNIMKWEAKDIFVDSNIIWNAEVVIQEGRCQPVTIKRLRTFLLNPSAV